ncbi:hypothetical protein SLEP1_g17418 [Rubroshorea leprosula]|uniref:Uncharacterized protein n=2 Tax=Rubroshorea leprosula TaxID=152421 RepID=A0AAV5J343_9ROSI|nr:hypothetical protein SLEP1_g17418 [Rubroshorea leprosula]
MILLALMQAAIRETMVLPNCESVSLPWMFAEKDDWVTRRIAPFIWHNQEAVSDHTSSSEAFSSQLLEAKSSETSKVSARDYPESKHQLPKKAENFKQSTGDASKHQLPKKAASFSQPTGDTMPSSSTVTSIRCSKSFQELRTHLLASNEMREAHNKNIEETPASQSPYRSSSIQLGKQNSTIEDSDLRPKKMGRRARMLDLGRKMGEKLEEKRRHIEEKSRHIVEKMRGHEIN